MSHRLANFVGFQIAWFACILGAARGVPALGPLTVGLLVAAHLFLRRHRLSGELMLLASAAVIGYVMDSALVTGGVLVFEPSARLGGPSPIWMVALWVNLAATLHVSLAWLSGRYVLSAVLGAIAGPLSYAAGARLGAVTIGGEMANGLALIALEWLVAMPLLVWLAARTDRAGGAFAYRLARIQEVEA